MIFPEDKSLIPVYHDRFIYNNRCLDLLLGPAEEVEPYSLGVPEIFLSHALVARTMWLEKNSELRCGQPVAFSMPKQELAALADVLETENQYFLKGQRTNVYFKKCKVYPESVEQFNFVLANHNVAHKFRIKEDDFSKLHRFFSTYVQHNL
jgi:hypothetical protein